MHLLIIPLLGIIQYISEKAESYKSKIIVSVIMLIQLGFLVCFNKIPSLKIEYYSFLKNIEYNNLVLFSLLMIHVLWKKILGYRYDFNDGLLVSLSIVMTTFLTIGSFETSYILMFFWSIVVFSRNECTGPIFGICLALNVLFMFIKNNNIFPDYLIFIDAIFMSVLLLQSLYLLKKTFQKDNKILLVVFYFFHIFATNDLMLRLTVNQNIMVFLSIIIFAWALFRKIKFTLINSAIISSLFLFSVLDVESFVLLFLGNNILDVVIEDSTMGKVIPSEKIYFMNLIIILSFLILPFAILKSDYSDLFKIVFILGYWILYSIRFKYIASKLANSNRMSFEKYFGVLHFVVLIIYWSVF